MNKIELKPLSQKYKIGKRFTIKSRKEINNKLKEIKDKLNKLNIPIENPVFCNFELEYVEENIDCFIGYTLESNEIPKKVDDLEIIFNSKTDQLVASGKKDEINDIYKNMINYAQDNKIQIRGFFIEIYKQEEIEIYVEAFDLKKKNKDYEKFLELYQKIDEIDKELIGEYRIIEILPDSKYMINPKKQKSTLNTKFKNLILQEDGTTNYENIKWNKKELIMNYDNKQIPLPIHKLKHNNVKYIEILMNENYEYYLSQRPLSYIYEKIK